MKIFIYLTIVIELLVLVTKSNNEINKEFNDNESEQFHNLILFESKQNNKDETQALVIDAIDLQDKISIKPDNPSSFFF